MRTAIRQFRTFRSLTKMSLQRPSSCSCSSASKQQQFISNRKKKKLKAIVLQLYDDVRFERTVHR